MDIFRGVLEVANALIPLYRESRSPGPSTWARRHRSLVLALIGLVSVPICLLAFAAFGSVFLLIAGAIFGFCLLATVAGRSRVASAPGMRVCRVCDEETPLTIAKCQRCHSYADDIDDLISADSDIPPPVFGWAAVFYCSAHSYPGFVEQANIMGLPVMDGGRVSLTIGPYDSQRQAAKAMKAFARACKQEGYLSAVQLSVPKGCSGSEAKGKTV